MPDAFKHNIYLNLDFGYYSDYLVIRMLEKISVPVSVEMFFDASDRRVVLKNVLWSGKNYKIIKVGLHHTYRDGRTLFHVFSVVCDTLFFRLVLNTENLHWRLEEISDGMPG